MRIQRLRRARWIVGALCVGTLVLCAPAGAVSGDPAAVALTRAVQQAYTMVPGVQETVTGIYGCVSNEAVVVSASPTALPKRFRLCWRPLEQQITQVLTAGRVTAELISTRKVGATVSFDQLTVSSTQYERFPADHCWRRVRTVRLGILPFSYAHETVAIIGQSGGMTTLRGQGRSRGGLFWENDIIDSTSDHIITIDSFTRRPSTHVHIAVQNLTQSPSLPVATRMCPRRRHSRRGGRIPS